MIERLWINNEFIPLSKSINPSLTKSITDIQEPDKRKATYSKSTRIPNSKEAAKVFGHIFEINLTDLSFNPGVKADVRYEVNGEPILEGYLQLKRIIQVDNKDIEYEVVMFGTVANIFSDMAEKYLDDPEMVDELDQWDHPFDRDVQAFSWATQVWDNDAAGYIPFALGTGYVYPLADYGLSTNLIDFPYYFMPCALYAKEYLDAIFDSNGYSYTSTFFDSTYFKSLIIPCDPRYYQLTGAEITAQEFSANTPTFQSTGTTTSNSITAGAGFTALDIIEFGADVSDPSNLYDTATGEYTILSSTYAGVFDVSALLEFGATFTPTTGAAVATCSDIQGGVYVFVNGVQITGVPFYLTVDDYSQSSFTTGVRSTTANPSYPDADYIDPFNSTRFSETPLLGSVNLVGRGGANGDPKQYLLTANGLQLDSGDVVTIRWKARYNGLGGNSTKCFVESGGGTFHTGTATVSCSVGAFYNKTINQYPAEGSTLKIEKTIPKQIKQKDFFMSLVKMFNLWVDTDPDNPKNYLIEPRDDFLGTEIVECQSKLAQDRELVITPMGKLDAAEYLFTYKQDKDYLNQKYQGDYNRIYGDRYLENTNEFVQNVKKTEIVFSPTPNSAPPNSTRVLPTIIQLDNLGQPKSVDSNIRIWYYGGLIQGELWNHIRYIAGLPEDDAYVTYPYAGHVDDPYTWTEDINFGLVKEVYYDDNVTPLTYTNNNLVNKYYSQMIQAYTAEESKIATGFFNVTPSDFRSWDFTKLYHFENAFWRLQKIESYNPTGEDLTKCTFLYLTDVPAFSSQSLPADGSDDDISDGLTGGDIGFGEQMAGKGTKTAYNPDGNNKGNRGQDVQGDNNLIDPGAQYIKIQGDSNTVNGGTKDIVINGDNNVIEPGVTNVTLINTNGVTVTESNVTYIDGKIQGNWETKTAGFTVDDTVVGYYLDASGGAYTIDVAIESDVSDWIFKCLDNGSNKVTLSSSIARLIDGEPEITLKSFESIRLKWNSGTDEYNIIN